MWKEEILDLRITRFFESTARGLLSILIMVILLAILIGIGCTALTWDSMAASKRSW
jgi:hypothetical protein